MRVTSSQGAPLRVGALALSLLLLPIVGCSSGSIESPPDDDDNGGGTGDPPGTDDPGDDGTPDGPADGLYDVPTIDPTDGPFVTLPPNGAVPVTLHPGATVAPGDPVVVSFGAPFPPGVVADVSSLTVRDAEGVELASHVEELARWRVLGKGDEGAVRAALVQVEVSFPSEEPMSLYVQYGDARSRELGPQGDPTESWVAVPADDYPETLAEPAVYATFEPDWLGACLFRTRTAPTGVLEGFEWMEVPFLDFSRTAVNDVDPRVTQLIDFAHDYSPWLFDRALTLAGAYARTGDVYWLRQMHLASQYYARHIRPDGTFDLKDASDLKYSYGQPLLVDLMLTGDRSMLDPIERIAEAGTHWDETYGGNENFWTERHHTYALLAALSAWEATGSQEHADRVTEIVQATFAHAANPPVGNADGCLVHTIAAHEGVARTNPVCSPWMSALLSDAVWRYYLHSGDTEALVFLGDLAGFVTEYGLYDGSYDGLDYTVPWYLVSSSYTFTDSGPFADMEHACDVAGLLARGAWARQALGEDISEIRSAADDLLVTCQFVLDYWHRPNGPTVGKAEWRLQPSRKYNWWFGTILDLPWMMSTLE